MLKKQDDLKQTIKLTLKLAYKRTYPSDSLVDYIYNLGNGTVMSSNNPFLDGIDYEDYKIYCLVEDAIFNNKKNLFKDLPIFK
jgi:hypothetical protein